MRRLARENRRKRGRGQNERARRLAERQSVEHFPDPVHRGVTARGALPLKLTGIDGGVTFEICGDIAP